MGFLTLISMLATPSFLLIAGFLFFRDGPISIEQYQRKLRSRFYTLLVPYLSWNLIAILVLCAPAAGKYYLSGAGGPATEPLLDFRFLAKSFIGWPIFPADAPLWFVRDLIVLVVIAPLYNLVPKRLLGPAIVLCGLYWITGPAGLIPGGIPRAFSVFFFSVGAWMGIHRVRLSNDAITNRLVIASAAVFVLSAAIGAGLGTWPRHQGTAAALLENLARVSGVALVVCSAARVPLSNPLSRLLSRLSPSAFFLFAVHDCVLRCVVRLLGHYPPTGFGLGYGFVLFALLLVTAVALSLLCYFVLKRFAPAMLAVLDGNRSNRAGRARPRVSRPAETAPALRVQPAPLLD